ncbi:LANO_0F17084g1_1 [Lachancea nothofagi CBS 11611]|uniref:LANO_0F17084g1_1 n=1 Tax=Lachancea nothofagi CBS 11611 TaxID=1266666 RepID=A0A1G4KCZ8_9SACH|nr:LANO_0F17084g1_1 [Lachancea nothofagi CBS 11611]
MGNFRANESVTDGRKKSQVPKFGGTSTIDDGLFEKLNEVVSKIDLVNEGASNDYKPLIAFFSSKFAVQAVQSWSYYAQVNNHAKFTSCTSRLARSLRVLGSDRSTLACGTNLIRMILQEYTKVLYRGLNNMKPSITDSMLRLMRQMVAFNKGQHVDDFLTYFDLALPSLPRILGPTKAELADPDQCKANPELSMRFNFIQFWLALIENASPLLRKAILTENPKIMSGWFKHMTKIDSVKLMKHSINTMIEKVLQEKSLRKATKCKILNESFISKLHHFYYSADADLVKSVDHFFELFSTSDEYGVAFSDDKVWFSEPVYSNKFSANISNGAVVIVNNIKFNLYNKLLYTMLTFFKPWEDEVQLNRVLQVLRAVPELVAPYCNHLGALGNHEPRATSYWFGMTLLLGRIINLPIPQKVLEIQTDEAPSSAIAIESIVPCTLTKAALTKALNHEVTLIKQMGLQLLVFSFQKLEAVLKLYDDKGWSSSKSELVNHFKTKTPEMAVISSTLDFVSQHKKENKVLAASLSIVLNHYSKVFPLSFSVGLSSDSIFLSVMKSESFTGLDLVMLDNFLQFQELNNSQTKWYNSTNGGTSIFTSLLRLASSNSATNALTNKVTLLLENLLKFSVLFNDNLTCSPLLALINSLQVIMRSKRDSNGLQESKIWKLLDETISRCMKMPYKYVDASAAFGFCSPFLIALIEQWEYLNKETAFEMPLKWLLIFLQTSVFIGEPLDGIINLLKPVSTIPESLRDIYLNFENYEEGLRVLRGPDYLIASNIDFSFFQLITLAAASELNSISRYPVNELDIAGLLSRIHLLQVNPPSFITNLNFSSIVDNLLLKAANYVLSQGDFKSKFTGKRYFSKIVVTESVDIENTTDCERYAYVTNAMTEIYAQLGADSSEFQDYIYGLWINCGGRWKETDALNMVLVNGLTILSSDQLQELLGLFVSDNQVLLPAILSEMFHRKVQISNEQFLRILSCNLSTLVPIMQQYLKLGLVKSLQFSEAISIALSISANTIVEEILAYDEGVDSIIQYLEMINDDELRIKVAAALALREGEQISVFVNKALEISFQNLESLSSSDFDSAIKLFTNCFQRIPLDQKTSILEFVTSLSSYRFTPPVAKFVGCFEIHGNKSVISWMQKSAVVITKNFSELTQPSERFFDFLHNFQQLHHQANLWKLGLSSVLISQIEAILDGHWVSHIESLEFLCIILLGADKSKLNSSKMLHLLLNNDRMCFNNSGLDTHIQFLTASVIFILFNVDPVGCSSAVVQDKLLLYYNGSISPPDRMILQVLEQIETKVLSPWTNNIFAWDYQETADEQNPSVGDSYHLITKEKEGFILTIRRDLIKQTVDNFALSMPSLPVWGVKETIPAWQEFTKLQESTNLFYNSLQYKMYDPMFLLLTIVNNEELLKSKRADGEEQSENYFLDTKKIVDSGLLEFIIMTLSLEGDIRDVALSLIHKMLESLDIASTLKEGHVYKVLLMKIAYTFHINKNEEGQGFKKVSPLMWYMVARICAILNQPTSFLYEKAYRWVFSSPSINPQQMPLFEAVVITKPTEDVEHYYRYLQWFLECITQGLKTLDDIELLKSKNLMEWILNLLNSPYISFKLQTLLASIIYKIQRIETGGPTLLTRFASASFLETLQQNTTQKLAQSTDVLSSNNKNKLRLKQALTLQQTQVNNSEIVTGFVAIANSRKRLTEWMEGDAENLLKRVCLTEHVES